jgi:hypothetical protein
MSDITLIGIDGMGTEYDSYLKIFDLCSKEFSFQEKILFTSSDILKIPDVKIIKIPKLSYKDYQVFCLNGVAEHIQTTHALFTQTDAFINEGKNWTDEFLNYDYVACPWIHDTDPNAFAWVKSPEESVGDGGFSLRSKKLLDLISSVRKTDLKMLVDNGANEDYIISIFFREALKAAGCKFSPPDLGKKFCANSSIVNLNKLDTSFGFHGVDYVNFVLHKYNKKYNLNLDDMINYKEKLSKSL